MTFLLNPYILATAGGGDLPPGAIAHLDFLNGFYYAGGAEQAVGDILGGAFDATQISGASGMLVRNTNTNRPNAIGALKTDLTTAVFSGGTIVVEFTQLNTASGGLLNFMDGADYDASIEYVLSDFGASAGGISMEDFWSLSYSGGSANIASNSLNKVAFTLAEDIGGGNRKYAHSINGGTVYSDTVTYLVSAHMPTIATIAMFHKAQEFGEMQAYIRTCTLYAAVDSTELPTLSTP
ncbi:hypothetical protein MesoLjLc_50450 [Mesorhizobium sp. L-8-10]|uniref:hypothetical protein n=1 Tax=Mesorhizobium sp. L-8-10 TaxID=2744523 RepID=UPI001927B484|nr:hypothetical protein [Mesorhizobium sp. L-8-10]BCH33115.1 hypothetical protein MesoLjLc_50450 [Mesorhizobium sp. L-8-10]